MAQLEISEATRREIFDLLTLSDTQLSGRLQEDEFLARLYDLNQLPSKDLRFRSASGEIHQHRVNWHDWNDDWIFYDQRFNLQRCPDVEFARFLCETVHPAVRPDEDEARNLVGEYNKKLARDGWEIVEAEKISGKPRFILQKVGQLAQVFDEPVGWEKVKRQVRTARDQLRTAEAEEHFQSVGFYCREVLISIALEVYNPSVHKTSDGTTPSTTDANRMLEAFFSAELPSRANEEVRSLAKASLRLANALQHKRDADYRTAAICLSATISTVNIVGIIANQQSGI